MVIWLVRLVFCFECFTFLFHLGNRFFHFFHVLHNALRHFVEQGLSKFFLFFGGLIQAATGREHSEQDLTSVPLFFTSLVIDNTCDTQSCIATSGLCHLAGCELDPYQDLCSPCCPHTQRVM